MSDSPPYHEAQKEVLSEAAAVHPHMSASLKREENALLKDMEEINQKFIEWKEMKDNLAERQNLQEEKIKDIRETKEKKRDCRVISNVKEEKTKEEKKWEEVKVGLRNERMALSSMFMQLAKEKQVCSQKLLQLTREKKALSQEFLSEQQRNEDMKSEMDNTVLTADLNYKII